MPISGSEQVILGDLSILADGSPVEVIQSQNATQSTDQSSPPGGHPTNSQSSDLARSP